MTPIVPNLIGRFGNQLFIYAYARALAEQQNREFRCAPWIGQKIFELDDIPLEPGREHELITGYRQNQESLIYTKRDCQRWFRFRQFVNDTCGIYGIGFVEAHRRIGDYKALGYVLVSGESYEQASEYFDHEIDRVHTEEKPMKSYSLNHGEFPFLLDFYSMAKSSVLFRGNSSFSWWAGTIGNAKVYSPVIDGLEGGKEHDCEFVEGNHKKFCNLEGFTDLHLQP